MGNTLDVVQIRCSIGTQKMVDFLAASPDTLTESERDIQEALAFIYRKNKEKGLFGTFPDWRSKDNPLTIDCTHIPGERTKCVGNYSELTNQIRLERSTKETDLIEILSHELKHAEQATLESVHMSESKDHLTIHQTNFIKEGQAYPFGIYVSVLKIQEDNQKNPQKAQERFEKLDRGVLGPEILNVFLENPSNLDYDTLEEKLVLTTLPVLYRSFYKEEYDTLHPLGINDKGLSQIPESFPLKRKPSADLLAKLLETPKEPYRNIAGWLAHNQKWEEAAQKISETGVDGKYKASKMERFTLFQSFLEAGDHIDFSTIMKLLTTHNKNGEALIDNVGREEFLKQLLEEHNRRGILNRIFKHDKTAEKFRLLRQEQGLFPSTVIQSQLEPLTPTDTSSKGLKQFDSEQQKKLKFLSQVTQIPEETSGMLLKNAVVCGLSRTARTMLNQVGVSRPDLMKILKSQLFSPLNEDINKTQYNNQIQIIHDILNLKDKGNHLVISERDVQMLICRAKNYKMGNTSLLEEAFQIYQRKNPRDPRFVSSDAMRFQVTQAFKQELAAFQKKHLPSINETESRKPLEVHQSDVHTQHQTVTGINNTLAKTQNPTTTDKTPHPTIIPPNHDPRNAR